MHLNLFQDLQTKNYIKGLKSFPSFQLKLAIWTGVDQKDKVNEIIIVVK